MDSAKIWNPLGLLGSAQALGFGCIQCFAGQGIACPKLLPACILCWPCPAPHGQSASGVILVGNSGGKELGTIWMIRSAVLCLGGFVCLWWWDISQPTKKQKAFFRFQSYLTHSSKRQLCFSWLPSLLFHTCSCEHCNFKPRQWVQILVLCSSVQA